MGSGEGTGLACGLPAVRHQRTAESPTRPVEPVTGRAYRSAVPRVVSNSIERCRSVSHGFYEWHTSAMSVRTSSSPYDHAGRRLSRRRRPSSASVVRAEDDTDDGDDDGDRIR